MSNEPQGSVTHWIGALKAGDDEAAQRLWERYFDELVRLARARLGRLPRGEADEEDAALSAFHSFCQGAARAGSLGSMTDTISGRLLVTITARKALDQAERLNRKKRGGGRVRGESVLARRGSRGVGNRPRAGGGAGADARVRRDGRRRVPPPAARPSATRRSAGSPCCGWRATPIRRSRRRLGCGLRTVGRKLELIRKTWLREVAP